jgi:short subunit dehydrogenase-like uncharacterized protein
VPVTGASAGLGGEAPARRRAAAGREFDVVLYGATGFVGRQTVAYFAAHAPRGLRWALAGRSAERLARVREACGPAAADAGLVVADAADATALGTLAARARVVLSTAGPFALYGDGLVDACVAQRTHYVDITGETPWVRRLIDRHHARAAAEGTRIVPCCGFDSVPSDLGAWRVASAIRARHGEPCVEVRACFSIRGGVNGGTLASALHMMEAGDARRFADPFLLNPPGSAPRGGSRHGDPLLPVHDAGFDAWLAPFVMAPVNTRVVRRSAALLAGGDAPAYDRDFEYDEYLRVGRGRGAALAATGLAAGLAAGGASLRLAPVRALVRRVVPAPGQGPSERSMDGGSFRCDLLGRSASGRIERGRIAGRGDPGNRATTTFVCESALALATDTDALPGDRGAGGVLTPASALGDALARRLAAAGMTLEPPPA